MALVLLNGRVALHAYVLVHIKVEQRPALAARLLHNEIIEGHSVRDDQVLLDIHQRADAGAPAPLDTEPRL